MMQDWVGLLGDRWAEDRILGGGKCDEGSDARMTEYSQRVSNTSKCSDERLRLPEKGWRRDGRGEDRLGVMDCIAGCIGWCGVRGLWSGVQKRIGSWGCLDRCREGVHILDSGTLEKLTGDPEGREGREGEGEEELEQECWDLLFGVLFGVSSGGN